MTLKLIKCAAPLRVWQRKIQLFFNVDRRTKYLNKFFGGSGEMIAIAGSFDVIWQPSSSFQIYESRPPIFVCEMGLQPRLMNDYKTQEE